MPSAPLSGASFETLLTAAEKLERSDFAITVPPSAIETRDGKLIITIHESVPTASGVLAPGPHAYDIVPAAFVGLADLSGMRTLDFHFALLAGARTWDQLCSKAIDNLRAPVRLQVAWPDGADLPVVRGISSGTDIAMTLTDCARNVSQVLDGLDSTTRLEAWSITDSWMYLIVTIPDIALPAVDLMKNRGGDTMSAGMVIVHSSKAAGPPKIAPRVADPSTGKGLVLADRIIEPRSAFSHAGTRIPWKRSTADLVHEANLAVVSDAITHFGSTHYLRSALSELERYAAAPVTTGSTRELIASLGLGGDQARALARTLDEHEASTAAAAAHAIAEHGWRIWGSGDPDTASEMVQRSVPAMQTAFRQSLKLPVPEPRPLPHRSDAL